MVMVKKIALSIAICLSVLHLMMATVESYDILESLRLFGPDLPFLVAREEGHYREFGLKDDFRFVEAKEIIEALRQGKEMVGVLPVTLAISEISRNQSLVIFAAVFQGWDYSIWARPSINRLQELANEPIAVPVMPRLQSLAPYVAFAKILADPKSLKLQPIPISEIYRALQRGVVDAMVATPLLERRTKELGLKKIYDLSTLEERIPHTVTVASESYLLKKKEKVKSLIKMLQKSINYAKESEEHARGLIRKYYSINDKQTVDQFYEVYVKRGLDPNVRPTEAMWERLYYPVTMSNLFKLPTMERLIPEKLFETLFK